ncbi:MAG: phosphate uptake regulator PhoU [Phycisphaerales bacterium]
MSEFDARLDGVRAQLIAQSERVYTLLLNAVDVAFDLDPRRAMELARADEEIDREDVAIERACVDALILPESDPYRIRAVLAVVKINNELERIADCAVNVATVVEEYGDELDGTPPATFRVMANSVIGIVRDANRALVELNVDLARQVLGFDETVASFKDEIGLDAEQRVAAGDFTVSFAFRLRTIVANLERVADHATNICEQVIYLESGKTVVQRSGRWSEPTLPDADADAKASGH